MSRCFISYSSSDRVMIESLARDLRSQRYEVWLDLEGIRGGTQWEAEIKKALEESEICLVALTPDAVQSDWVKREIDMARNLNKLIIPLLMRDIPLPHGLEKLAIADLQHINFVRYGYKIGVDSLIKALPKVSLTSTDELRALIVEDIPAQQVAVQEVLSGFDLQITIAPDFETALEQIRGGHFDLITLDMQLDAMDVGGQHGILLLDQLRTYQRGVPVIIISALNWTGSQVRDFLREYKAFDYLQKPFKPSELRPIIEAALKKQ